MMCHVIYVVLVNLDTQLHIFFCHANQQFGEHQHMVSSGALNALMLEQQWLQYQKH